MKFPKPISEWFFLPLLTCQFVALVIYVMTKQYGQIIPTLAMFIAIAIFFWSVRRTYAAYCENIECLLEINRLQEEKIAVLHQDCEQAQMVMRNHLNP